MKSNREKRTQKADRPVELPKILGPMMLPSTCCKMMMKIMNTTHLPGSVSKSRRALGMAPKKGPNTGMILVMPTIRLMIMV